MPEESRRWTVRAATVVALLALTSCTPHAQTYTGAAAAIDASLADSACPSADAGTVFHECATNDDCVSIFSATAPSGTLFATCFQNRCAAAEYCVVPNAGSTSYCVCGDVSSARGCADSICIRADGARMASCVDRVCAR